MRAIARKSILFGVLAATAVAGCQCDDDVVGGTHAELTCDLFEIQFDDVPILTTAQTTFTLNSRGTAAAVVSKVWIEGSGAAAYVVPEIEEGAVIAQGGQRAVDLKFAPEAEGSWEALLVIESNDPESPLVLQLNGVAKAPDIELCIPAAEEGGEPSCAPEGEPLLLDFGRVIKNREGELVALVRNVGEAALQIEEAVLSEGAEAAGFSPEASLGRASIPAGGGVPLPVKFLGKEQGEVSGRITLVTKDPDEREVYIDLVGNGAPNQPPEACAAVWRIKHQNGDIEEPADPQSPLARPADRLFFTAHPTETCSLDPEDGQVLRYRWSVVSRPDVSGARMNNASSGPAPNTTQQPPYLDIDAVGTYRVELVVTDALNASSAPVYVEINAVPQDDITIELTWHQAADLDLHLIAPSGGPFCTPLDCFWDTCINPGQSDSGIPVLDWGDDVNGDQSLDGDTDEQTDPILVRDSRGSTIVSGTDDVRLENIRLARAPIVSGVPYRIGVHYFADEGVTETSFPATVKVVYQGLVLLEETFTFDTSAVGTFWYAGEMDIELGTGAAGWQSETEPTGSQQYNGPPLPCVN